MPVAATVTGVFVAGVGKMLVAATGNGDFRGWSRENVVCSHRNGVFSWLDVGKCPFQPREWGVFVAGVGKMLVAATGMGVFRGWGRENVGCSHGNGGFPWLDVGKCWFQPREWGVFVAGVGKMLVAATRMGVFRGWMLGNARFSHGNGCFSWLE